MRKQLYLAIALVMAFVVGVFFSASRSSAAGLQCGDHQSLAKHLADKFSESLQGTGVDARGQRIELYRSDAGSWTLVVVLEEGPACVLSTGGDWEVTESPRKGLGVSLSRVRHFSEGRSHD
jgi:hypothetical protein